jgi:hypothetical protein
MSDIKNLIISGSSISNDDAWPVWSTFVKRKYTFKNIVDVNTRGAGNEVILTKAITEANKIKQDLMVVVQLTSVDKWDWYVQDPNLVTNIQNEKHPGTKINSDDKNIFWCTGSHFPLWKEYYKKNYYSLDYHAFKALQLLQWFELTCNANQWNYLILTESPIFSVTEEQLNTGKLDKAQCNKQSLLDNTLCNSIKSLINLDSIYLPGLIGYACLNDLPWYHPKFKSHPGSLIHYRYAKDIIFPEFDKLNIASSDLDLEEEAAKFQKIIDQL